MILGKETLNNIFKNYYGDDYTPNGIDYRLKSVEVLDQNNNEINGIVGGEKSLPTYREVEPDEGVYTFKKGEYYILDLGKHTIPDNCICLYFLRSTIMRCGGVLNSSVGDIGYTGTIKVGFYCFNDINIDVNERVVQAIYLEAEEGSKYDGDYKNDRIYKK